MLYTSRAEYRALHWDFKNSVEYRPGAPNIELFTRSLNIVLNIPGGPNTELYIGMLNTVLNICLKDRI